MAHGRGERDHIRVEWAVWYRRHIGNRPQRQLASGHRSLHPEPDHGVRRARRLPRGGGRPLRVGRVRDEELLEPGRLFGVAEAARREPFQPPVAERGEAAEATTGRARQPATQHALATHAIVVVPAAWACLTLTAEALDQQLPRGHVELRECRQLYVFDGWR